MTSGTSLSIAGLFPGYGAIVPKMCTADRLIERPKRFRCRVGQCLPFGMRLHLRVFAKLAGNRAAQEGCHARPHAARYHPFPACAEPRQNLAAIILRSPSGRTPAREWEGSAHLAPDRALPQVICYPARAWMRLVTETILAGFRRYQLYRERAGYWGQQNEQESKQDRSRNHTRLVG